MYLPSYKEIIRKQEYINWLHNFLKLHPAFFEDDKSILNTYEDEKNMAFIDDTLYYLIKTYYNYICIATEEIHKLKKIYTTTEIRYYPSHVPPSDKIATVSVNFDDFSVKFDRFLKLHHPYHDSLRIKSIEKGTGLCDFSDVLELDDILDESSKYYELPLSMTKYIDNKVLEHQRKIVNRIINYAPKPFDQNEIEPHDITSIITFE